MIKLWWYNEAGNNTGDTFTPWMLDKLGLEYEFSDKKEFIGTGSIFSYANKDTIIWGSGIHRIQDIPILEYDPSKILAVRGNLTKEIVNVDVPVGDPGLLLSKFHTCNTSKKYKYGILAHYVDYKYFKQLETPNVPVYNMVVNNEGSIDWLADRISECDFILSSSLHGIIFSHSLGVPAVHIEYIPLYSSNNFKFKDYYSTLDVDYVKYPLVNGVPKEIFDTPDTFLPSREVVEKIKNNLWEVFPWKS